MLNITTIRLSSCSGKLVVINFLRHVFPVLFNIKQRQILHELLSVDIHGSNFLSIQRVVFTQNFSPNLLRHDISCWCGSSSCRSSLCRLLCNHCVSDFRPHRGTVGDPVD
uniref:Post-SET domain-containing protein n=1 Tax=Cacopsylla melanoneura TaxID=428564 RepID=A0A8D8LYE4_9HEMI